MNQSDPVNKKTPDLKAHGDRSSEESSKKGSSHAGQGSQASALESGGKQEFQPSRKGSSAQRSSDMTTEDEEKSLDVRVNETKSEVELLSNEANARTRGSDKTHINADHLDPSLRSGN